MYKFFVTGNQIQNNKIKIIGEDINHISNVLRLKKDDKIIICNKEDSTNYVAKIAELHKEEIFCHIINKDIVSNESNINIDIFQGIPKADKMEYIIQKATEIGVKNIFPVQLDRCIGKIEKNKEAKKIERWQKIAEVAAKQSKRDIIPEIKNIINLENICNNIKKYDKILVAYENEQVNTLKKELQIMERNQKLNIGILIGPEGGLTEKEVMILKENGAKIITLGKRILRTETASIVVLSNIMYEFEL